jgi:hypothetical protein
VFSVFGEIRIGLDSLPARQLYDFDAVIAPIDAGSDAESAGEETVLDALGAVVKGGASVTALAVDAER